MSTFKDILYKKNDDETWSEWTKRVPDNDEDKLDYIGETIYDICIWDGKENAYKITEMMIELGLEQLIPLLENEDLLNAKIEEVYKGLCQKESLKLFSVNKNFLKLFKRMPWCRKLKATCGKRVIRKSKKARITIFLFLIFFLCQIIKTKTAGKKKIAPAASICKERPIRKPTTGQIFSRP